MSAFTLRWREHSDGPPEGSCGEPVVKAAQVLIYGVSQPVLITARGGKEQISSQPTLPSVACSVSGFPSLSITPLYRVFERSWPSYLSIPGKSPIRLLHSEKVFISFFFFLIYLSHSLSSDPGDVPMGH